MKYTTQLFLLFAILVAIICLIDKCGKDTGGDIIHSDTTITVGDTNIIGHIIRDTVLVHDTVFIPKTVYAYDPMSEVNFIPIGDSIRTYENTYTSDNVKVMVWDSVDGALKGQRAKIESSIPVMLRVDTVTITNEVIPKPKGAWYAGVGVASFGVSYKVGMYLSGVRRTKKGVIAGLGYDMFHGGVKADVFVPLGK